MSEVVTEKSWKIVPAGVGRRDYSQNVERYDVEPTLLLFEGFEELPPSWLTTGSPGYSVTRDTNLAWRGGACLKIVPGGAPEFFAGYYQHFGLVSSLKLLLEARFRFPAGGDAVGFCIDRFKGTEGVWTGVSYLIQEGKWQYMPSTGVRVDIPGGAQVLAADVFHHVSMAVDFSTEEYLYMQCNEKFVDLKSLKPWARPAPDDPEAHTWIWGSSTVALSNFYIDNVRVAEVI